MKMNSLKEGQLAPREAPSVLWLEAHVNHIDRWEPIAQGASAKI